NHIVRTSETVEVTNADGSITKTMSVEFENEKAGLKREVKTSKTFSADGKLLKIEHLLTMTTKNFTREATRTSTFEADGAHTVTTSSVTTFTDGRKKELNEERTVNADGT